MSYSNEEAYLYNYFVKKRPREIIIWLFLKSIDNDIEGAVNMFGFLPKKKGYRKYSSIRHYPIGNEALLYIVALYDAIKLAGSTRLPEMKCCMDRSIESLYNKLKNPIKFMIKDLRTFELLEKVIRLGVPNHLDILKGKDELLYKYEKCIGWLRTSNSISMKRFGQELY